MSWLGQYHYIFVHFPIALIIMAGVAELIMILKKDAPLNSTVNFLLISAALWTIPTVATGLLLEDTGVVKPANHAILEWHQSFAFTTLSLVFATIFLRYWLGRHAIYWISFALMFASVIVTAHFGGIMAFNFSFV